MIEIYEKKEVTDKTMGSCERCLSDLDTLYFRTVWLNRKGLTCNKCIGEMITSCDSIILTRKPLIDKNNAIKQLRIKHPTLTSMEAEKLVDLWRS